MVAPLPASRTCADIDAPEPHASSIRPDPYDTRCGCSELPALEMVWSEAPVVKCSSRMFPPWLQAVQYPAVLARTRSPPNKLPSQAPAATVRYGLGCAMRQ